MRKELFCVFEDYSEGDRTAQPQRIETLVTFDQINHPEYHKLDERAKKNHSTSRKMQK